MLVQFQYVHSLDKFDVPISSPLVAIGVCPIVFLSQVFAIHSWIKTSEQRKGVWSWHTYIRGFLALGLLGASVWCLKERIEQDTLREGLLNSMKFDPEDQSENATKQRNAWDYFQKKLECCGVNNYSDWQDVAFGSFTLAVPDSCCLIELRKKHNCGLNMLPTHPHADKFIHTTGCFDGLNHTTHFSFWLLGLLLLFFGIYQLVSLAYSFNT